MKIKHLLRFLLVGAVLYLGFVYLDGVVLVESPYGTIFSFVSVFAVFAIIEVLIYPIMKILILPLRLVTFGLATAALSVNLVYAIAWLHPFFEVASFWYALLLGVAFGIVRFLTK